MKVLLVLSALLVFLPVSGQNVVQQENELNYGPTPTHLFNDAFKAVKDKETVFIPGGDWFPYPAYNDRAKWKKMTAPFENQIRKAADKYLNYEWKLQKPSEYLEYEKTGNRKLSLPEEHNRQALIALTLGELMDGTGKYMSKLADGIWFMSQQYSWAHMEHTKYQKSKRCTPSDEDYVISLHGVNSAATLAIAYHFFKEELDKIDPSICQALESAMEAHVFTPFMDESKWYGSHRIWSGFSRLKGDYKKLNNWAPYCVHHALTCFLLMEKDQQRLLKAIDLATQTMDFYMSDQKQDGACDEGPGYWGMSFAKVYDFACMLRDASKGKANVLKTRIIRRMGEYKSKTYLADGWVLGFGDTSPRALGEGGYLFRFGMDTGSVELMNFAMYLLKNDKNKSFNTPALNFGQLQGTYCQLETMRYNRHLEKYAGKVYDETKKWDEAIYALRSDVQDEFYPESQYAVLRSGLWNTGFKSSHNGESHNHNDVGSCVLVWDGMPVVLDIGAGKYRKETFSSKRYTLWFNRSDWHATPSINGVLQQNGEEYASKDTECNMKKGIFKADIAGAYPEQAACRSWVRSYELKSGSITITDSYKHDKRIAADVLNFPIRGKVVLPGEKYEGRTAGDSEVLLFVKSFGGRKTGVISVRYSSNLIPGKEEKDLAGEDTLQKRAEMPFFTRLYFKSSDNAPLTGNYEVKFIPSIK